MQAETQGEHAFEVQHSGNTRESTAIKSIVLRAESIVLCRRYRIPFIFGKLANNNPNPKILNRKTLQDALIFFT